MIIVNQEKLDKHKNEIRISEIINELDSIDTKSLRPLRSIQSGNGTDKDRVYLDELEQKAIKLRSELTKLKGLL